MSDLDIVLERIDFVIKVMKNCEKINRETIEEISDGTLVSRWIEGKADAFATSSQIVGDLREQIKLLKERS